MTLNFSVLMSLENIFLLTVQFVNNSSSNPALEYKPTITTYIMVLNFMMIKVLYKMISKKSLTTSKCCTILMLVILHMNIQYWSVSFREYLVLTRKKLLLYRLCSEKTIAPSSNIMGKKINAYFFFSMIYRVKRYKIVG